MKVEVNGEKRTAESLAKRGGNRKVDALVRCCGGCVHFDSEDISGGGWCNASDHATTCGDSCPDWHDDFYTPNATAHVRAVASNVQQIVGNSGGDQ